MANDYSIDLELSSSQYLSITDANQTGLDLSSDFTFEAWIKLEQLPSVAGTSFIIFDKEDTAGDQRCYRWYLDTTDTFFLTINDDGTNTISHYRYKKSNVSLGASDVGVWVHTAVSFTPTSTAVFYKNGVNVGATDVSGTGVTGIFNSSASFKIGSIQLSGTPSWFFDGKIDEARVWNDIRTDAEIVDYKGEILNGTEANLVGYWRFENDLLDETANNNDLTNNNSATFASDPAFTGTNEYAVDLEKDSSQYLSITDANQTGLDVSEDISIEAWIKLETLPSANIYLIASKFEINNDRAYSFYVDITGTLRIRISDDGTGNSSHYLVHKSSTVVDSFLGIWLHVAFSWDMSAPASVFYFNGKNENGTKQSGTTIGANIYNSSAPFSIGCEFNSGSTQNFFDGLIDCVRVWSDIRSSSEIADNYTRLLTGSEGNLVGCWQFENDLLDMTSNNNDLTNNNSATFVNGSAGDTPFNDFEADTGGPGVMVGFSF